MFEALKATGVLGPRQLDELARSLGRLGPGERVLIDFSAVERIDASDGDLADWICHLGDGRRAAVWASKAIVRDSVRRALEATGVRAMVTATEGTATAWLIEGSGRVARAERSASALEDIKARLSKVLGEDS